MIKPQHLFFWKKALENKGKKRKKGLTSKGNFCNIYNAPCGEKSVKNFLTRHLCNDIVMELRELRAYAQTLKIK